MNKRLYFMLQLKRSALKLPVIIFVSCITVLVAVLLIYLTLGQSRSDEDTTKVRIGVVGDSSESYLGMGMYALQNFDSSRFSVEFVEMDEQTADRELESGSISGYVNIPDDFIKGILKGKNTPAQYYMRKGAVNFGSIIISEITGSVSDLVTQSQTAIYSMQDVARALGKKKNLSAKTKALNLIYIDHILNRIAMFETELTGVADELSMGGYYVCAFVVLMLMLWGISCCSILSGKNIALSRLLGSRGMKATGQVAGEYLGFLLLTVVIFGVFAVTAVLIPGVGDAFVPELKGSGVGDALAFTFAILPVILMITSMQFAVYEVSDTTLGAVLMLFLISFGLGYVSGCFYPLYFFPEALQKISVFLPFGAGFSYVRKLIGSGNIMPDLIVCVAYCVLFGAVATSARKLRMGGDRQ